MNHARVVVITGGSGFLAQHLIKQLEDDGSGWSSLKEIRVVDRRPFKKILDYTERVPIKEFIADCSCDDELAPALIDASVVFNCAARLNTFSIYQDATLLHRDNVASVACLIRQMRTHNVPHLVHVSDDRVVVSTQYNVQGAREAVHTERPKAFGFGGAARTKLDGELLALDGDGTLCDNGGLLRVIVVRPAWMYGEGDSSLVPQALRFCRSFGALYTTGAGYCRQGLAYVGNVAQMLCESYAALLLQPDKVGGEILNSNDYQAAEPLVDHVRDIVEDAGYKVGREIPYAALYPFVLILETIVHLLDASLGWRPLEPLLSHLPCSCAVRHWGAWHTHTSGYKAQQLIGYKPMYDVDKAKAQTRIWWKDHNKDVQI